ncbi:MAG: YfhO family protein, partial [Lachnospiraceae bacterium]|nr:YfhO family protein [Lachnospiraceae bacterium]
FAAVAIPSLIMTKGVWIYYGDFNVQQIPFYNHLHAALKSGKYLYDWGTDLGGSFVGCYSFYILGSPFFWLTMLFSDGAVPYIMAWVTALKYGVMAATAYGFMKRHLRTETGAYLAAIMYAFAGYQGAVLVYNHFHDAVAFFPLFLCAFENLFVRRDNGKRRVAGFVLMCTLMLVINYYFFVGQAVFCVIYYFTVCADYKKGFKSVMGDVCTAFFCGVAGVLLAGAYILPAVYYTLGNSRLSQVLLGYDLVAYSEPTMLLGIVKNVFMLPDVSGLNSMLNQSYSRVSGIGGYIPLFSMAGVIAYFLYNKGMDKWKRLLTTCLVFAVVPVLNSLFSALNSEYYARWYYMPLLIMAMLTGWAVENRETATAEIRKGAIIVMVVSGVIALIGVLPAKTEEGALTVIGALKNYEQLISEIVFTLIMTFLLYLYLAQVSKKSERFIRFFVTACCVLTAAVMFYTGTLLVDSDRKTDFMEQAVFGESPIEADGTFYRIETDEDFYNYPMFWEDTHSITAFISTIPDSTFSFYHACDIPRKVTSHPYTTRIGARAILSARYFLTNNMHSIEHIGHIEDMEELKGYSKVGEKNGFNIYENENYIPMGFSFDEYITDEDYSAIDATAQSKDRILPKYLIVSEEDSAKISECLTHAEISAYNMPSIKTFGEICSQRRATACTDFTATHAGFRATADMERENYVFFSVPYEEGFSAYVDGEEAEIVKVDYGFMAVRVPEGKHAIEFKYLPSGLKKGIYLSLAGLVLFFFILLKNCLTLKRDYGKLS